MKAAHLQKLQKAYKEKRLIPFIGAGLSTPFKIPTWGQMIDLIASRYVDAPLIPSIKYYIDKCDYWNAISSIKEFGKINEMGLQKEICDIVKERVKLSKSIKSDAHNYYDLANFNVLNYITTNYDFLLYEFLPVKTTIPQVLHKVDISSQLFFEGRQEPRIWHLHGHIDDYGSIIISKEKYEELYSNNKYIDLFKLFQGNGVLLFMGFSFNDYYIQDLLKRNNMSFNSEHFIILDKPKPEVLDKFVNEFGINVIEYDSENNTKHATEIRDILKSIQGEVISAESADKSESFNTSVIDNNKEIMHYPKNEAMNNMVEKINESYVERSNNVDFKNNVKGESGKKIKVGIADDHHEFGDILSEYLGTQSDIEVVGVARDGIEAISLIENNELDIILLDLIMPHLDGFGVLERMKSISTRKKPITIITTDCKAPRISKSALALGAHYYMIKPFDMDVLVKRIRQLKEDDYFIEQADYVRDLRYSFSSGDNENDVCYIMNKIGVPTHIKGYQYIRDAVSMVINKPGAFDSNTAQLYAAIATQYGTTPDRVERGIWHAIKVVWGRENINAGGVLSGYTLDKAANSMPTNFEFIASIAAKIKGSA